MGGYNGFSIGPGDGWARSGRRVADAAGTRDLGSRTWRGERQSNPMLSWRSRPPSLAHVKLGGKQKHGYTTYSRGSRSTHNNHIDTMMQADKTRQGESWLNHTQSDKGAAPHLSSSLATTSHRPFACDHERRCRKLQHSDHATLVEICSRLECYAVVIVCPCANHF